MLRRHRPGFGHESHIPLMFQPDPHAPSGYRDVRVAAVNEKPLSISFSIGAIRNGCGNA